MTGADDSRCPILVVDNQRLIGAMMVLALQDRGLEAHQCVVSDRAQILADAAALPPGLLLLDLDLDVDLGHDAAGRALHGVDLVADLQADGWRVIVVTGRRDEDLLAAAVMAGAEGVFHKSAHLSRFLEVIQHAVEGRLLMPPAERRRWVERHRRNRVEPDRIELLTAREREVLEHLASGMRAAAIASRCEVSLATVRSHIRAVLAKLEVGSQLEAVAMLRTAAKPLAVRHDRHVG